MDDKSLSSDREPPTGTVVLRDPLGVLLLTLAVATGFAAGGPAALLPTAVACMTGYAFFRWGGGEYTALRLFGAALLVRNAGSVATSLLAGGRGRAIFPDEAQNVKLALEGAARFFGPVHELPAHLAPMTGPDGLRRFSDDGFAYLMSPLAALHGSTETLPALRSTAALIGALGVCACWWAGKKLVGSRAALRAALVYAFFPTSVFWSSMALKDSAVSALLLLGLGLTLALAAETSPLKRLAVWGASLWVCWFLLLSLREHVVFVAATLAVPTALVLSGELSQRGEAGGAVRKVLAGLPAAVLVAVVASTALWAAGYGVLGVKMLDSLDPGFLAERSEMESRGASQVAPAAPGPTSPESPHQNGSPAEGEPPVVLRMLRRFPPAAAAVAFRPFPWETPQGSLGSHAGEARFFLAPAQVAWYLALALAAPAWYRLLGRHPTHAWALAAPPGVLFFFYGLTQANLGTAFRLREVFVPFVLLAASVPRRLSGVAAEPSVAFLLPTIGPGGTEGHVFEIADLVAKRGRRVRIVVLSSPPGPEPSQFTQKDSLRLTAAAGPTDSEGGGKPEAATAGPEATDADGDLEVRFGDRRSRYDLSLVWRLSRLVKGFDCCSTYLFAGNFWGGIGARMAGSSLVSNVRTTHPRGFVQRLLEPMVLGELVVCNSRAVAEAVVRRGVPPSRIRILRNGVSPAVLRQTVTRSREEVLGELGIPPDSFVVCLPARFDPLKDQLTAVEAFRRSRLSKRSDCFLVLVGSSELPTEKAYRRAVAERVAGLEGVLLCDFYSPLSDLIAACDAVMLSSVHEGMPNVLLEAAALARPVVATTAGGSPEVVIDGETGILVPPEDPDAMARALETLFEDRPAASRMGEAARDWIEREFSIDKEVEVFLQLVDECILLARLRDVPETAGQWRSEAGGPGRERAGVGSARGPVEQEKGRRGPGS